MYIRDHSVQLKQHSVHLSTLFHKPRYILNPFVLLKISGAFSDEMER